MEDKEFNLSSKIDTFLDMNIDDKILYKKDVKEFIRRLKEPLEEERKQLLNLIDRAEELGNIKQSKIHTTQVYYISELIRELDKLAGAELTDGR